MAGEISRKNVISRRVAQLKDSIEVDTQKTRGERVLKTIGRYHIELFVRQAQILKRKLKKPISS